MNTSKVKTLSCCEINECINIPFTYDEVKKIIHKAKKGKALGIDGLTRDLLKNAPSIELLTVLFNVCLKRNLISTAWTLGIIGPIPKCATNDPRVPLNCRSVSLLSVSGKLYTAAISHRLSTYLAKENKICDAQNGFRPNRSCTDHIYSLCNICNTRKSLHEDTYITIYSSPISS